MPPNPYALADRRQRRARRRVDGLGTRLAGLLPLVGAVVALPLLRPTFYGFLDAPPSAYPEGASGAAARLGLALAAGLALASYAEVIRGPDRGVIDLHPLLPAPWIRARIASLARARVGWLAVAAVFLAPLWPRVDAVLAGAALLAGAWFAGMGAGLGINLAAPRVAEDPRWAGVLDGIRGPNPRLQAALLYAPGVSLALSGASVLTASWGLGLFLRGDPAGLAALAAPVVVGIFGLWLAARNAAAMARLPALLGEIDAAWAAVESQEESHAVYLEWAVRFVPVGLRRDLLKELRHLWRGLRPWVTGSWGLAVLAALAGWTKEADAAARLTWVGGGALLIVGYAGVRLGADDPAWLDAMLPAPKRPLARFLALVGCMQAVILAGMAALAVRQGIGPALGAGLRLEVVAVVLAALGAGAGDRLRGKGGLVYVPAGIVAWAAGGAW